MISLPARPASPNNSAEDTQKPAAVELAGTAPAAHRAWGPESWPPAIRENLTEWPPPFRERQLVSDIRTPFTGTRRIVLLSRKDGVGKGTTARILHHIFSTFRDDNAVIVDASGDAVVGKYVEAENDPDGTTPGVVQRVGKATAPVLAQPPGDTDYGQLMELAGQAYQVVLTVVGTSVDREALQSLLAQADQLVVIATPAVDGLFAASACLDDVRDAGYPELADSAIVAINRIRTMPFSDLLTIDRHFARRCAQVIRVPWDSRISEERPGLDHIRPTTKIGFFELAAAVARRFGEARNTMVTREEENVR